MPEIVFYRIKFLEVKADCQLRSSAFSFPNKTYFYKISFFFQEAYYILSQDFLFVFLHDSGLAFQIVAPYYLPAGSQGRYHHL